MGVGTRGAVAPIGFWNIIVALDHKHSVLSRLCINFLLAKQNNLLPRFEWEGHLGLMATQSLPHPQVQASSYAPDMAIFKDVTKYLPPPVLKETTHWRGLRSKNYQFLPTDCNLGPLKIGKTKVLTALLLSLYNPLHSSFSSQVASYIFEKVQVLPFPTGGAAKHFTIIHMFTLQVVPTKPGALLNDLRVIVLLLPL